MAKHAHLPLFINGKTWRCQLEGCAFFVHQGLQHILIGKAMRCWRCEDTYTFNENNLKEEKPICPECKGLASDVITQMLKDKGLA